MARQHPANAFGTPLDAARSRHLVTRSTVLSIGLVDHKASMDYVVEHALLHEETVTGATVRAIGGLPWLHVEDRTVS